MIVDDRCRRSTQGWFDQGHNGAPKLTPNSSENYANNPESESQNRSGRGARGFVRTAHASITDQETIAVGCSTTSNFGLGALSFKQFDRKPETGHSSAQRVPRPVNRQFTPLYTVG
jgi:hypothetical protein